MILECTLIVRDLKHYCQMVTCKILPKVGKVD